MPELPEVETTRRGIAPYLEGQRVSRVVVRDGRLRWPIPEDLDVRLSGQRIVTVQRRAKYLLLNAEVGTLISHLGMSGNLRLVELGLLEGDVQALIESEAYRAFYMHRAGHWLGMDVHDVGEYKVGGEWRVLEPGMALTVEPGIYIGADNQAVAKKWRGIGVRIEDDVVVTRQGCEILTSGVPRTVAEIEALMQAARKAVA